MTTTETYIHSYRGFTNQECRCIIRILDEKDKPLTVICAQDPLPHETSITNMAEYLHDDVCRHISDKNPLKLKCSEFKAAPWSKRLEEIISLVKKGGLPALLFLIQQVVISKEFDTETEQRLKDLVWVEYYPSTLDSSTPYIMRVSFDDGQPRWQPTTFENLSRETRFTKEQLQITQAELDAHREA